MARVFEVVETTVRRWRVALSDEYVECCKVSYQNMGADWAGDDELATCAADLVDKPWPDDATVELVATETTCRSAELTEEAEHETDEQAD